MPIQPSTFHALPPKEDLLRRIEEQRAHIADLTSYMWFIIPVAERFGDEVYDVAAAFLAQHGFEVTPTSLKELAAELTKAEGKARYAVERRRHAALLFGGGSGPQRSA